MCISNYIKKHYAVLTYVLCGLLVLVLGVSAYLTLDTGLKNISIGIIILLFADLVFTVLSIVSMVSMFNEVSRLHAREFPKDAIDQMEKLQNKYEALSSDFNTSKQHVAKIEDLAETCAELKKSVSNINNEIIKKEDVVAITSRIEECCKSVSSIKKEDVVAIISKIEECCNSVKESIASINTGK